MTNNHTPAPWHLMESKKSAMIFSNKESQIVTSLICPIAADLKLIAAAPDLLSCLTWYVENDDTNDSEHNAVYLAGLSRAKDAIAKATGE